MFHRQGGEKTKSDKKQDKQQHPPSCPETLGAYEYPVHTALRRLRNYGRRSLCLNYFLVQGASKKYSIILPSSFESCSIGAGGAGPGVLAHPLLRMLYLGQFRVCRLPRAEKLPVSR
jgi:hypothetical protein